MKYFALNMYTVSPLAIRSDHAPGGAEMARYIAGTTLAGSLASVHRLYHPYNTEDFEALFLSGQVQYPDLYPATFEDKGIQDANLLPIYPIPKTAKTCKRFPGFRPFPDEEIDDPRHGVRDSLLDWAMFELVDKASDHIEHSLLLKPFETYKECPDCRNAMDYFSGYYRRNDLDGHMTVASSSTRLQTHTGINRDTGTVQEGILYNRRVFDEHTHFWGMLKLPEQLAPILGDFIGEIGLSGLVRVGTGRTRGSGKVYIGVEPLNVEEDMFTPFKKRLKIFDDALRKQVGETFDSSTFKPDLKPFYFALTLHSPVIVRDHLLRYRGTIDAQTLEEELKLPAEKLKLIYQTASTKRVTGWNELWGTPRTNEYAIESGSVFLFSSTTEPDDTLLQALFKLEEEGIGRRRSEGFGRICVSDPFHLEVKLR